MSSSTIHPKSISKSQRAQITFPISRVQRYLKIGRYANHIGTGSAVYLAAVLEYLTAEVLIVSGDTAKANKKRSIRPRHIKIGISQDDELAELLKDVTISEGGVVPHIESVLLPISSREKLDRNNNAKPSQYG